ncbi:MAG: hypothetical protein GXY41_07055 [Phycisphaerae bacterium]|nr:hypothetical protein [Phycisphaerae bacterium]
MKKWTIPAIALCVAMLATSCRLIEERIIYESPPEPPPPSAAVQPNAEIIERRFVSPDTQSDAVQSAVAWANKYEEAVEQNAALREQQNLLALQNNEMSLRLEAVNAELERTRKELAEANVFIQEMHAELNKSKADVLGFREEMRLAQKAQLEALSRILQVLGAEPVRTPQP